MKKDTGIYKCEHCGAMFSKDFLIQGKHCPNCGAEVKVDKKLS